MSTYHSRVCSYSENACGRTTTFATDLCPMTHAALERRAPLLVAVAMPKMTALLSEKRF